MPTCEACSDKKHVFNETTGQWDDCVCLLKQRRNDKCRQAAIPEEYWGQTVDQLKGYTPGTKVLLNQLKSLAGSLRVGQFPEQNLLIMGKAPYHRVLSWLLLKASLASFEGLSISLDDLTTEFLKNDKRFFSRARDIQVLNMIIGEDYTQVIHKHVLNHVANIRKEKRFYTIWSTTLTVSELIARYGQLDLFDTGMNLWMKIPQDIQI